jgi:hypothetical protein
MYDNDEENKRMRKRSGEVRIKNSRLTSFLYGLLRDHLPSADVEQLVRDSKDKDVTYTNGWLARYAQDLAKRLQ